MGEKVMTLQPQWQDPAGPLLKLATALSITRDMLQKNENAETLLYYNEKFPTATAQHLSFDILQALVNAYGEALTFQLLLGGLPVLNVNGQLNQASLAQFQQSVKQAPNLILDLKLDKMRLLQLWGAAPPHARLKLFLFADALFRALNVSLLELENNLLREADGSCKMIILAPDCDIALNGDYLSVLGGAAMAKWQTYLPAAAPNRERVKFVYDEALKSLKWVYFSLKHLTPLQLEVKGTARRDDKVARALYAQLIALCLVYTADQTIMTGNGWRATFAAGSDVAEVAVGNAETLTQTLAVLGSEFDLWAASQNLVAIFEWAYSGERGAADRLSIMQGVVARALPGKEPLPNYQELLRQAGHLKEKIKWGWAAFIEDKLNVYFSQVRGVEEAVDTTVAGFNEQVHALVKALTDNTLAAVGVIVGSFIAAIFADKFNATIFRLGVLSYAAYLLIFPGVMGLYFTWQRYRHAVDAFDKRRKEFNKRLFPEEVKTIVGTTVQDRERWFRKWFWVVTAIHVVMVALLALAAWKVPALLRP